MFSISYTLLAILGCLLYYLYSWGQKKHQYWAEKGVAYIKPLPLLGNLLPVFLFKIGLGQVPFQAYRAYPEEKMVGYYTTTEPALAIRDPELIERIAVKDFQYFVDRPRMVDTQSVAYKALFTLKGNIWRTIRFKISPVFTTGRLRTIYQNMDKCSDILLEKVKANPLKCDVKTELSNYALHTLSTGVYGIEISDQKTVDDFTEMAAKLFYSGKWTLIRQLLVKYYPNFSEFVGFRFFDEIPENYFRNLLKMTFEQRIQSKASRNDFLDYLLKLKQKGKIEILDKDSDDNYLNLDEDAELEKVTVEFSDDVMSAMALQFLLGGFHPLVQVSQYTLFELAKNIIYQEKARNQIHECVKKHGGYTYDSLKDMTFLDQCIHEVLRLHPLVENLERVCTRNYTTPDGVEIESGTTIMIPILELGLDPKIFPNPNVFDPERFAEDNPVPSVFLPFGSGPRICIGMRYALLVLKAILAKIVGNFTFKLNSETNPKLEFDRLSFVPLLKTKILIDFTPLE